MMRIRHHNPRSNVTILTWFCTASFMAVMDTYSVLAHRPYRITTAVGSDALVSKAQVLLQPASLTLQPEKLQSLGRWRA